MFIETIARGEAEGLLAHLYDQEEERWGFLPNLVQVFGHHPSSYERWLDLIADVYDGMDRRRCELATLAASWALKSSCCSIAHGKNLRDRFFTPAQVVQIVGDHHQAGLDDVEVAVIDFAEKVADAPSTVTQADVDTLRSLGLTDREVFDVVLAVAARAFLTTLVEALGMAPEQPFVDDLEPDLLDVLVVGRPLS